MAQRPNSAVLQTDSNKTSEEIVSDSITCLPSDKTNRPAPTLFFDGVTCPREEKKEERRPHTSPIHPEPREYTLENPFNIIESYARTDNRTHFAQLSTEMKLNSLFTYDKYRNTPLSIALFSGMKNAFYEFLQLLSDRSRVSIQQVERYLNIQNIQGRTSAHFAVLSNDEQSLTSLLSTNAINFNALDFKLRTIFHYLPESNIRIPSQLRNNKFSIHALNYHDSEGRTPLHIAVEKQNVPLVQAYIDMGGDLRIVDQKAKYSVLQYAARSGNLEIIHSILSRGNYEDIDYQSPDGLTALYLAVSYNHITAVQMLIANGADPMILRYGNSILTYTQTAGDTIMRTEIFKSLDSDDKWQFLNSRIDWVDNEEEYAWEETN